MSKIPPPNYTQVPNVILDHMDHLSDAELRVLLCVCRNTFGWHQDKALCSSSFIAKATGMSVQGVLNGVSRLLKTGVIERQKDGDSFSYWVAIAKPAPLNGVERQELQPLNGVETPPLNGVETNKERGQRNKKGADAPGELKAQRPPSAKRELTDGWCAAYEAHFRRRYKFEGAKDGRAADRLLATGLAPAELLGIARRAWAHPDWFNCKQAATLAGFECRYNDIRAELDNPPDAPRRRHEFNGDTRAIRL